MKTPLLHRCLSGIACAVILTGTTYQLRAQDCATKVTLILNNIKGGVFPGQAVTLRSLNDGKEYKQTSNSKGEVVFALPCEQKFDVQISNYTRKDEITSPPRNGGYSIQNFSYSADMKQKDALFAMTDPEKATVDKAMNALPDTTFIKNALMTRPVQIDLYSTFTITLKDLDSKPLVNEQVVLTGEKRKKSFKGRTNVKGEILLYLPKGDTYSLNFLYHKDYRKQEVEYRKGTSNAGMSLMYLGTAEILRRKKAEEERIKAEEARLKREREEFIKWCKELKITEEEGHRRKLLEESGMGLDTVVMAVLHRNKWSEKLIVCDLTGSMNPYANQLSAWYQLNYKKETNLQFVFFNDGDSKADHQKVIGSTGGIYYQSSKGLDSLIVMMSKVRNAGHGGDCPENNMEALIKGIKLAKPYKELVMIVDNYAPVKDISLLKNFNKPVHIILCGSDNGEVLLDYLLIAWKTKGSVHTIEEDIYKIAGMLEGESIVVGGVTYRIMGGEFVRVTKS
ncbi:MAG: hypothetical protein ACK5EK_00445 [Flavobacteriia bacterium]|jgi:hypothetical protein